jgi:hypothetical protein
MGRSRLRNLGGDDLSSLLKKDPGDFRLQREEQLEQCFFAPTCRASKAVGPSPVRMSESKLELNQMFNMAESGFALEPQRSRHFSSDETLPSHEHDRSPSSTTKDFFGVRLIGSVREVGGKMKKRQDPAYRATTRARYEACAGG